MTDSDWNFSHKGYLLKNNNKYFKSIKWVWKDPIKKQFPISQIVIFTDEIKNIFVFRETISPQHYIDTFPECKNSEIVNFKKEIRKLKLQKIKQINEG